jgi:serine/threonine protein kinase
MSLATRVSSYDPFEPNRLNPPHFDPQSMDYRNLATASTSVSMSAVASNAYSSRSYTYASPSAPTRRQIAIGSRDTPLSLPSNTTDSPIIRPEDRERMSASLCDLLRGLLTKCALYRPTWNAIETHPFWLKPESIQINPLSSLPLVTIMPEQPAYEVFLK